MMENDNKFKLLINETEIDSRVKQLGQIITNDYIDKKLLLVGILKGSFVFLSDLMRAIQLELMIDFMSVSSYRGTMSTGNVTISKDISTELSDSHILLVEDILDSGRTLYEVTKILEGRNPISVEICALLDKPSKRVVDISAKYIGFTIPDEFVVGYGLDFKENYRNLRDIVVLNKYKN
ncbi:MAG: hypoxanthine phosphoribosyltransferase [Oscillospiraceae bacterium]|nr:hypoxanthine phosphoribosyltransferase [Oscillospiraceae bacterium]